GAGAGEQVVAPHAVETLAVTFGEARPGGLEVGVPGHQRAVVVGAEVVYVLYDEELLGGVGNLPHGRQRAVGKDVAFDPRVGGHAATVLADGVQHEQTVVGEHAARGLEIGAVVLL